MVLVVATLVVVVVLGHRKCDAVCRIVMIMNDSAAGGAEPVLPTFADLDLISSDKGVKRVNLKVVIFSLVQFSCAYVRSGIQCRF